MLKKEGTLWLNLGDSYSRDLAKGGSGPNGKHDFIPDYGNARKIMSESKGSSDGGVGRADRAPVRNGGDGLKPKDLIGIPWMVAFALRADGWYLRQDIIWSKNNCMPESVTDRCTKSHEYLFLFAKSQRYYFDSEAIKESSVSDHPSGNGFKRPARVSYQNPDGTARGNDEQWQGVGGKRNKRSVWQVNTVPYREAHFATFPEKLIEPCIRAGCPEGGICLDPFFGAGTTGLVAKKLGRRFIGIELNEAYIGMAQKRVAAVPARLDRWAEADA